VGGSTPPPLPLSVSCNFEVSLDLKGAAFFKRRRFYAMARWFIPGVDCTSLSFPSACEAKYYLSSWVEKCTFKKLLILVPFMGSKFVPGCLKSLLYAERWAVLDFLVELARKIPS
jgi:hypothetical protein